MITYSRETLARILSPHLVAEVNENAGEMGEIDVARLLARESELGRRALADDGGDDRSRHAARVIERLHFERFKKDEAIALIRERGGSWKERYKSDAALTKDPRRIWSKYAARAASPS